MSSASSPSPVKAVLEGYVAGRVRAEHVVTAVAAAYYAQGARSRERLRPVVDVIERAHPGVVELAAAAERPGFAVRMAERPFPREHEEALRDAVQAVLGKAEPAAPRSVLPAPGVWSRIYAAVRRLFTASP